MKSEFLEALLSNELNDQHSEIVQKALRDDHDLREAYFDQAEMDQALRVLFEAEDCEASQSDDSSFNQAIMARLQSEGAGNDRSFSKEVLTEIIEEREGIRPICWPDLLKSGLVAAVASIALMFVLQAIIFRNAPSSSFSGGNSNRQPGFVAQVEISENLVWAEETAAIAREDGWLKSGLIEIESGVVKLAFNSGATALVEGPASLSLESENRVFLKSGSLTAEVPPPASGFAVNTPRLNVVDIGTRFGVNVDSEGNSEVHVMEGEVEASRSSGNSVSILLREGLGLRADDRTRSELQPIPYAGDQFTITLGERSFPEPDLHYPFDESTGGIVLDASASQSFDAALNSGAGMELSPLRGPGKSGTGLVFQKGQSMNVALNSSFRRARPHTIGLWVKIAPTIAKSKNSTILHFGRDQTNGWNVSCNFEAEEGKRGALRLDYGGGFAIGSSDLSDGKWHHIAYRFIGGEDADISSHVHLFVDGELEPLSGQRSASVEDGRAGELTLGSPGTDGFLGWIDDLKFYNDAIPTRIIQNDLQDQK